jgi:hypothetical protein
VDTSIRDNHRKAAVVAAEAKTKRENLEKNAAAAAAAATDRIYLRFHIWEAMLVNREKEQGTLPKLT